MQSKFLIVVILFIFCFLSVSQTIAQQESTSILMNIIPSNPSPGEDVSITLSSYAENLDIAIITWFVDGKSVLSGVGEKSLLLKAPGFGLETKVIAKIKMAYEETQVSTVIKPSQMIMLWQATDSYVPPFYKGKALLTPDSYVKVVALPEIKVGNIQISPRNLTYAWQKDFNNVSYASGYGKNYFIFKNDYLENLNTISVTAYDANQSSSSRGSISLRTYQAILNFYKRDIEIGTLWENSLLNNYSVSGNDIIVAEPYFISPKDIRRPELVFSWEINDVSVEVGQEKRNVLPIAIEEGVSGNSKIKLEIDNKEKLLRTISKEISISF